MMSLFDRTSFSVLRNFFLSPANALLPGTSGEHQRAGLMCKHFRQRPKNGVNFSLAWFILAGFLLVDGRVNAQSTCVYALDKTANSALSLAGTTIVNSSTCGMMVDSSSSTALNLQGTSSLNAKSIQIVGGYTKSSNSTLSPAPQIGSAYQSDPLAFFTFPTSSSCTYTNFSVSGSVNKTLSPGTYCNGIVIGNGANVTFQSGTYLLMGGGLNLSGTTTISGSGVTFFATAGLGYTYKPITISGTVVLNLTAPTSGPYQGLLFWQDHAVPAGQAASSVNGTSSSKLQGVFYFPTTGLVYTGTPTNSNGSCVMLVADTITFGGTTTLKDNSASCPSLLPAVGVSVSPSTAALYGGQTQQFTATVTNTVNTAVTWSINPSSAGTISANGLYTAPSAITTQQPVTVTATSQADPTKSASVTIALMPPIAVLVSPPTATLYGGQMQQFAATVANTNNTAVAWSLVPANVGSINANGLYTAPSTIAAQQTVTVIATSLADPSKSAAATITLMPPVSVSVAPVSVTLYGAQTQRFTATVTNTSNTAVTWSISPAGAGTIDASGNYTAPVTISAQQTVIVTATSQADATKSASATVALSIPITISVSPSTATLSGGQTQAFSATVTNTSNTAVSWSISPGDVGTINSSGLYTAPATITSSQTVTITVTSQGDSTKSASATITLVPTTQCTSNGYSFVRSIVIDHNKVPNIDQANFPFLFSSVDPAFKSMSNGGHVTNSNGFDIIFTSDAAGSNVLPFEQESYNASTGAVIYWINVPTVSHVTDSVIYMWYGNSNIATSQANAAGTWSNGYLLVAHLLNTSNLVNSVTGVAMTNHGATNGTGGVAFSGSSQYIDTGFSMGSTALPITVDVWANHASGGGNPAGTVGTYTSAGGFAGPQIYNGGLRSFVFDSSGHYTYRAGTTGISNSTWYKLTTVDTDASAMTQYENAVADGVSGSANNASGLGSGSQNVYIGVDYVPGSEWWSGAISEVRISNVVRSPDWIATEYNNQNSPSTFYTVGLESEGLVVSPATVNLYTTQVQQFTVQGSTCVSNVVWSMPPNAPGTLNQSGLYSAPPTITAEQTVLITATSTSDPTKTGIAAVTLTPAFNPTLTLVAAVQPPYVTGASQQFVAALTNQDSTPLADFSVSFTVNGVNNISGSATTDGNGFATFAYTGAISGSDTIQASTSAAGGQVTSNKVFATWIVPSNSISTTTVLGRFFPLTSNCCWFNASPASTPVFEQVFPTINFDPPSGAIPGNTTVGTATHPFTDVTLDKNGSFSGTIVAQGNGYQAGSGTLTAFQASFTGSFIVANGGDLVIPIYVDNSFILGIGGGATRVSGPNDGGAPSITPFGQYPVMGALSTSIGGASITVHFPGPGTYPYELDYAEDGVGLLSLMMMSGNTGVSSGGTLTLSPSSVQAQPVGGKQLFTVTATDAAGNPVPTLSVGLVISLNDTQELSRTTDSNGVATFTYVNTSPGTDQVQAVAIIGGMVAYSNIVTVPWTSAPSTPPITNPPGSTISISVTAQNTVILPNNLHLSAAVSDSALPSGGTIALTWSQVSGTGTTTFSSPSTTSTTASFSEPGGYVLQLSASDPDASDSVQFPITVNPAPGITQGWIGSPAYGSEASGIVPITVASGETLTSGVLTFYPADNPINVTILNSNTTGSGPSQVIGTFDTTNLANGQYWITLQATDSTGSPSYNLDLVTVVGNNKPGRVTSTVTDLVVPAKGLAIKIQRTYDSLNANKSGDFGYGWSLGTTVDLSVNPNGSVTFTLGGQRKTFILTPQILGWFLPYYVPIFTPEPGMHGTLTYAGSGCPDLFDFLLPDGNLWACVGGGFWTPPGYVYTDPTGTAYTMTASGQLQSIVDKNGNALTITPNGITSSTGLSVPFERDSKGRITKITDPQNHEYQYFYDDNGNLSSVEYPSIATASSYTYDSNHLYLSGSDFNGNPLPQTGYYQGAYDSNGIYQGDTDLNGHPLNGRLKSVTTSDGAGATYVTTYSYNLRTVSVSNPPNYNLVTNTTTVTYPADASGTVGTATLGYNSVGDVVTSQDPNLFTTTNAYDSNRNLVSVTAPAGEVTSYTYDSNGNRTSVAYPNPGSPTVTNTKSTTSYNQFSEPTQTVDELGNVRTFNYDVNFNPQSVSDNSGALASFIFSDDGTMQAGAIGYDISANPSKASQFTYDADGNMICRTDALGRSTSYSFDSLGHKISMTEPQQGTGCLAPGTTNAGTTSYTYDDFGNLTKTSAPLGRTTSSQYDGNGNKTQDTDADGNVTKYQYDALNRLKLTTYADGSTDQKSYDFRGNLIQEIDQSGNTAKYVYDPGGRLSSVTRADGTPNATKTSYAYDNDGRKITETDNAGHATHYSYDAAGNLIGVSGVAGTFTYAYDNARNRVSMTDGNGHKTGYQYDARKRLIETDYPDTTNKKNTYDGPGNLIKVTDQNSKVVEYKYDAGNQLQSVIQDNSPNTANNSTSYSYDPLGNLMGLNDTNSHLTESNFDFLSEQIKKTLPDQTLYETRGYDEAGNLTSLKHFNGKTTTYTYDKLNRLVTRTPDPTTGEPAVNFTYTGTGKRHTMADASGTTTYSYDNMDRLITKQTSEGTLTYTYDDSGHLASMTSSNTNGVNVSYNYDTLNRLSTVVDSRLGTTTYSKYDDASNVTQVNYPNGVQTAFVYDQLNRMTQLATSQTGYLYTFDLAGNRQTASEYNHRAITWNYDDIYRLTGETITSPTGNQTGVTYGLDPVGNRLSDASSISGISSGSFTYDADDQIGGVSHDANGNTTQSGVNTFAFDSENHLVSMNGGAVGFRYDGDGNRVAKLVNGAVTTTYLVDDLNPTGYPQVVEELTGGAVVRQYTYGLQRISQNQLISNAWTPSFYGYDGAGSVRQLFSSAGVITDTYDYDAFGNKVYSTGSTPNDFLYRGEEFDSDLGLYYLRARYMNPLTGRFMSRDPKDGQPFIPKTLHKYLYAGGDPVNASDPTGRDLFETGLLLDEDAAATAASVKVIAGCVAGLYIEAIAYLEQGTKAFTDSFSGFLGLPVAIYFCPGIPF